LWHTNTKTTNPKILKENTAGDNSPPWVYHFYTIKTKLSQMKKITTLTLAILFLAVKSNSQITKGNWLVGGNMSFSLTNYKSDIGQRNTAFTLQIAPNIGYFFTDKFAIGLKAGINKHGGKATGTSVYSFVTDFNLGPFIRYYFLPVDKQLNILVEGSYQYGFIGGNTQKTSKNTFAFAVGPVVYFNTSVGLEFLIGYSTSKYVGFAGSNGTIQVGLGLEVHLERD